ncbi:MAG: bifunctional 3,4-dihydroxy-2-butanone-4-phosphate synthase/GTP cyclohydrolase II [Thermodesulfobacteriota bacterium]
MSFATIEEAIKDIAQGRMVILVDDEDRENEGDLTMAAEMATADHVNFMAKYGRGLICVSMTEERARKLNLQLMVQDNTSPFRTAFTVSVDAKKNVTTGISAYDRAVTIQTLVDDKTTPSDIARPGHIFPLIAKPGGVLARTGQTEGSVDLARLAGLKAMGVICEIMKDDGTMARRPDLEIFAQEHGLKIVTIADLVKYRLQHERLVHRVAETVLPTSVAGEFRAIAYKNDVDPNEHLALVKGTWGGEDAVLVRVHSECVTGDVLHSLRCDCGEQLHNAMKMIDREGKGALVYMRQEGRGIGLCNKLKAYALQDQGKDTVEANLALGFPPDQRDYGVGAQILMDLGIRRMRLMTNNPTKYVALAGYGLEIVERVPLEVVPHKINLKYLQTKRDKMGHMLKIK